MSDFTLLIGLFGRSVGLVSTLFFVGRESLFFSFSLFFLWRIILEHYHFNEKNSPLTMNRTGRARTYRRQVRSDYKLYKGLSPLNILQIFVKKGEKKLIE